ncbi:MAG: glycosyltransferase, partial [Solirubrobacterales bacterium]
MTMASGVEGTPDMSVVIVTDSLETIAKPLRNLRAQTIADRLELVLVAPRGTELDVDALELQPLWQTLLVEIDDIRSLAWAREPGIRAARAPIVALAESHTYHEPRWAEALVEAHRGPWAAVGPAIANANPTFASSWASLIVDYGPWVEPEGSAEMADLPGHNSSYKRSILTSYGPELKQLLEAETLLHEDLRRKGHRLWMEPGARVTHLNVTLPSSWVGERVGAGRRFGAARAANWSWAHRLLYAAASPLIPLVRLRRMVPVWRRCRRRNDLPRGFLPA